MKSLTVLIPNYNGEKLLKSFLPSIFEALKVAKIDYEFIVVDDCSTDGSIEFLNKYYPDIIVLKNSTNLGFAHTCNRGIAIAKGERLLLLNSDIKLSPKYIKICLENFKDINTFAINGLAIENRKSAQTTGLLFSKGLFKIKKKKNIQNTETHFVSGANPMFDTDKLKAIGGFNPIYSPYYFEDDDLSIRAHKNGWKSFFLKEAICYHLGSHTIKNSNQKKKIKEIYFRNKFIFNYLHGHIPTALYNVKSFSLDVLPKLLIGQFWIWNSFFNYTKKINELNTETTKRKYFRQTMYEFN